MNRSSQNIFPVGLLLENKPCLVVGGGKISSRKVALLMDAGALITVISPELTDELSKLANQSRIRYLKKEFVDKDIDGFVLVYCATDNKDLNNTILTLCRNSRILCCSIDSNWIDGDFITPATVRQNELTVAISTGGKACRRSRLVKASISRHLSLIDISTLAVIGTSHLELPIDRRESVHCTGDAYIYKAEMISQIMGIHEFVLINTCNRIELYLTGSVTVQTVNLLKRILDLDKLENSDYYFKKGIDAFEHGIAVCSGLLSQLPGEQHIAAQFKDAVAVCSEKQWAGTLMQEWLASTLYLSREVRQSTSHILKSEDIEEIAVKYLCEEFRSDKQLSICILGTGMVGTQILTLLRKSFPDADFSWVYHNRIPEISSSGTHRINLLPFDKLETALKKSSIIISAVQSDNPVISKNHVNLLRPDARLVDLSIPRTIDPALRDDLTTQKLFDLDDLRIWYRLELVDRNHLLSICRKTVMENRELYDKFITSITGRNPQQ